MYLTQIKTTRFQSHREVVINLPTGIITGFVGDNSNGKSIIRKALKYIITGAIKSPSIRKSAVCNTIDGNSWAEVQFTRNDGLIFLVHIDLEASKSYHLFRYPNGEEKRANLSSKTLQFYVEDFGFHYDENTGRSLNYFDPEDALLFFNTDSKQNYSILESTLSDTTAERVRENLIEHKKEIRLRKKATDRDIERDKLILDSLTYEDPLKLAEKYSRLQNYYSILKCVYLPTIEKISPVPEVILVNVHRPTLSKFILPIIVSVHKPRLSSLSTLSKEIVELSNYRCPYCKRAF